MLKLLKKSPHSELFWSIFSFIRIEYGDLQSKSPYSVRMLENTDQKTTNTFQTLKVSMMLVIFYV